MPGLKEPPAVRDGLVGADQHDRAGLIGKAEHEHLGDEFADLLRREIDDRRDLPADGRARR
jgi:hypothetical protein